MGTWFLAQMGFDILLWSFVLFFLFRERSARRQQAVVLDRHEELLRELVRAREEAEKVRTELEGSVEEAYKVLNWLQGRIRQAKVRGEKLATESAASDPYRLVERLVQKGFSAGEIASRVPVSKGEIDLIMGLKGQRAMASG
ncbi:MAG: hypothetical protein HYY21_07365 [Candidatus Tectomicrobia bacterium]|nr:hypothetical protein [Candidatus Tectomicrobia bacterium]